MSKEIEKLIEDGLCEHSVYTHCRSCHTWGTNQIKEKSCGNCGNITDTTTYYPEELVTHLVNKLNDYEKRI